MQTLRSSRVFTGAPISLRALGKVEGRRYPLSLRDVVTQDGARQFSGQISAGSVDCTWVLGLWQNGTWAATGDFHDGGVIAGDFFTLTFILDAGRGVGVELAGSILEPVDSRHTTVDRVGNDPWIRDNWQRIEASGPSVSLHASPALGAIASFVLIALGVVAEVVFGDGHRGMTEGPCNGWSVTPQPGSTCVNVTLGPGDGQ